MSVEWILASRSGLAQNASAPLPVRPAEAEGGCGVIGIASSVAIHGRHLLQALAQMRNRGNGKGGGVAAIGLDASQFGVSEDVLRHDYLLAIAYLDPASRPDVEARFVHPTFDVDHVREQPHLADHRSLPGLDVRPPEVVQYFVRVKEDARQSFKADVAARTEGARPVPPSDEAIDDEIVYQNTYRLNEAFYEAAGVTRAFVLSHGKNLLVLKMVGYGDDVVRYYGLEETRAHVWIGHHRYPTKGKVWHPGGAHPFVGLHEALVHNGDFANYASITEYLAQRRIRPLFLTDTEVSVLVFDLLSRTYAYPLEYVIEALAPTTERDFTLLPEDKRRVYEMLQTVHMHGSPDGPWFFLIAQSDAKDAARPEYRLLGVTDTSMLRPQVFALQRGAEASIGFAASEKQAIDAALESLSAEDDRFWSRADTYWNARGGSHTDGGAFLFSVRRGKQGDWELVCTDKFGRRVEPADGSKAVPRTRREGTREGLSTSVNLLDPTEVRALLPHWSYDDFEAFLDALVRLAGRKGARERARALDMATFLMDTHMPTGGLRRSRLLSLVDRAIGQLVEQIREKPAVPFAYASHDGHRPETVNPGLTLVLDGRGFPIEGPDSLARALVSYHRSGWRRFSVVHTRGHRFLGNGLGPVTNDVRIDVYGSAGDYLASGIDGAEMTVHNNAQDQLCQIMKYGRLVVHGDVGQTFMYGAKGGQAFVLGNAAGRPLINAVGKPRVVINGTCLDYLAESFMAGDPHNGGGFVILNGVRFDPDGALEDLPSPYPGGNLFSLASGGAIYVRDPHRLVGEDQLNGGAFRPFEPRDWDLLRPMLEENERLFGIPVDRLLRVDGERREPGQVYRRIRPGAVHALQAEEAWVTKEG